ncbi:MAG: flagellar motor protein MotB [Steroidobacteraceae bacterium]
MAAVHSSSEEKRPIIVVKRRRTGTGGHHGGAWKVAYADFVTAMMAFFMVMWLVASVSNQQRAAIYEYFRNPSMEPGKSTKPAPGQMGPGGASTSPINMQGGLDAPKTIQAKMSDSTAPIPLPMATPTAGESEREEKDRKQLDALMQDLKEAINKSQALEPFKDQLLLDIMPEGLRIQIVDAKNRPMFDVGSARLKDYTVAILWELAPYLSSVENRMMLVGHTDVTPYSNAAGYTNWELSADRANSARRALAQGGVPEEKIARVVGMGSVALFDKTDPKNPINRRISIIVMTKQADDRNSKMDLPASVATSAPDPVEMPLAASPAAVAALETAAP